MGVLNLVAALCAGGAAWLAVGDGGLSRLRPRRAHPDRSEWWRWLRSEFVPRAELRRRRRIAAGVAMTCDLLAVCVEAGRPPRSALRVVAEVAEEPSRGVLMTVLNQIDLGVDERRAWRTLAEQPGYAGMARDVARSVGSGVPLGPLLRTHALHARESAATDARARARQVSVTGVFPLVVCFLPAFLLVGVVPIVGGALSAVFGG